MQLQGCVTAFPFSLGGINVMSMAQFT
ncbi:hypothetical protein L195_g003157, partial [Trifolium pratense]